jgi:hypothetical protein
MARSAHLACIDCKVEVWIGVGIPSYLVDHFNRFGDEKRNWQDAKLNQVVWKMFADHAGHHLCVLLEWTPEYDTFMDDASVVEIGGGKSGRDISFEEYLKGWEG